jgi:hypothetical protein
MQIKVFVHPVEIKRLRDAVAAFAKACSYDCQYVIILQFLMRCLCCDHVTVMESI